MNDLYSRPAEDKHMQQRQGAQVALPQCGIARLARLVLLLVVVCLSSGCGLFQKALLDPLSGGSGSAGRTPPSRLNTDRLVISARQYLGTPYRFGGTSHSGIDCSGLTQVVFQKYQVSLPRNSREQSMVGIPVKRWELDAGDLVFFDTNRNGLVNHVGIYVGNHKIIHASPGKGVIVDSLLKDYYTRTYVTARRIPGPSPRSMAAK